MGKERFVSFSVATSVAATQEVATETTSMIDAAIKATLPAVGQSAELEAFNEKQRLTSNG